MISRLHFFTTRYPFGNSESFVHNELCSLSKFYDEIYIYPIKYNISDQLLMRELPTNVRIIEIPQEFNFKKVIIHSWLILLQFLFLDFKLDSKHLGRKKSCIKLHLAYFAKAAYLSQIIEKHLDTGVNHTFYSFWMHEAALSLSILKHKKLIENFNFKCHGFDVYNEVHKEGFIPFRVVNYHYTSNIITISYKNANYIASYYPFFKDRLKVIYLGSDDVGITEKTNKKKETFLIFSCANLIPLKRVTLIPQILAKCRSINIKWVHAGDGVEREQILRFANELPSNIQIELLGNIPHEDVYNYYKTNDIDLFLHLSASEGLPVSMMEAISFGVPIIACDVGGVSEIVNENTGILLPKDFNITLVANQVENFLLYNNFNKKKIRDYWKQYFNHKKNVKSLIILLSQ